jgi:inosose dehydratase
MVAHLVGFEEAVRGGVFQPLGEGAVPVADIIRALEHRDDVWWVLEQDMSVPAPPAAGEGPVQAVARSLAYALAG